MPGTLFVVATPIGNLEDVTLRALRVLRQADLVAAEDTRRAAVLLAHHDIRTPTTSFHEHNEQQKLPVLLSHLAAGKTLAVVSDAGTPGISDPGFRLVRAALESGAHVDVIPGPSAVVTALVASGFPTSSFTFLGFPPRRGAARRQWLAALAAEPRTCVFFEAPHRIQATLEAILALAGDRTVAVARELTKVHQEIIRATISRVLPRLETPRGEFTVVVSPPVEPGRSTKAEPSDLEMWTEFGQMTTDRTMTRRVAIRSLARKYAISPKSLYQAIERVKKRAGEP